MNDKRMKDALESIARRGVLENTNLWPELSAKLERKSPMTVLRSRPLAAVLIALLVLLTLSGAVYALGRALGYIPGMGVVDQNTAFHVLPEPVSQTRDGVTVTVEQAILNTDKIMLTYKVDGLTPDKFSFLEPLNTCMYSAELHFPAGEIVGSGSGEATQINGGFEDSHLYSPVPPGAKEAVLVIPCIQGALAPGLLPENWELPLEFVAAPPNLVLTMMPVTEIAPTFAPIMPTVESTLVSDVGGASPVGITQIIDTGDHYILVGEDHPADMQLIDWILTDGNGQPLDYQVPSADVDFGGETMLTNPHLWAVEIAKGFTPPVHITHRYRATLSANSQDKYEFEFNMGTNPQQGQVWDVNQEFQLAGHTVRLTTITADLFVAGGGGLRFDFRTDDPAVNHFMVDIDGYTHKDRQFFPNNYAEGDPLAGQLNVYLVYPELPKGKLKVIFSNLYLNGEMKIWTVDWQP